MKHIVLFKLKERTAANQDTLVNILNSMQGQIPFVEHLRAAKDFLASERSYDVILEVILPKEELEHYATFPYHVACKQKFADLISSSITCDIE